jgi:hypothetical protein
MGLVPDHNNRESLKSDWGIGSLRDNLVVPAELVMIPLDCGEGSAIRDVINRNDTIGLQTGILLNAGLEDTSLMVNGEVVAVLFAGLRMPDVGGGLFVF